MRLYYKLTSYYNHINFRLLFKNDYYDVNIVDNSN